MNDEILKEIQAIKDALGSRFIALADLARELARAERASVAKGRKLIALPVRQVKQARGKSVAYRPASQAKVSV